MTVEAPPPAPAAPARTCPRCGAGLAPDQEWCLSCGADVGSRIAAAPPWRVPVAIVGLLLGLALAAVAVAILELADDEQQVAQAPRQDAAPAAPAPAAPPPGEQPAPGEQGAQPGQEVPEATDDSTAPTDPGATDPGANETTPNDDSSGAAAGDGAVAEWPAGRSAWTVILESSETRAEAERRAEELAAQGTSVGLLDSDDFSSLRGGYWVVFSGQYDSRQQAEDAVAGLASAAPDAYVRRIEPR
jgi:septal ring-binding cell division protein DamX